MKKKSIIIVGAGAAGLMAALNLESSMNVIILEAAGHAGGRMQTLHHNGNRVESGAEFVHGNLPVTMKLLKSAGITPEEVTGKIVYSSKGKFTAQPDHWEERGKMLKKMKALKKDSALLSFMNTFYNGTKHSTFRESTIAYAEGFDLADPATVSVKSLYEEWSNEDEANYRIPGGYTTLINFMENQLKKSGIVVHYNSMVTEVNWTDGKVEVLTAINEKYKAHKLLLCVPLNKLAINSSWQRIQFDPQIDSALAAVNNIGAGKVIKVVLRFKKPFWKKNTGFVISDQEVRTWWTQLPDPAPVLTGWSGGNAAIKLAMLSDEEILNLSLTSLSAIFSLSVKELRADLESGHVFNWVSDELCGPGYSFSTTDSKDARKLLKKGIGKTIYFAGEAMYSGRFPGTVEAAFQSAKLSAGRVLRDCEK